MSSFCDATRFMSSTMMPLPADKRRPVPPKPQRWQPNPDPATIHVPGLDTTASVHDQIEQIEQLITIKLQNIDENFARIHNLLATKVLPAVKRYAVGTEPVREAAKFWTSFYEHAAQIRIPSFEEHSTVNDVFGSTDSSEPHTVDQADDPTAQESSNLQENYTQSRISESSIAMSDSSFAPAQAAFSSTPAANRFARTEAMFSTQKSDAPSWMESPLVRLSRDFQEFSSTQDTIEAPSLAPARKSSRVDEPSPNLDKQPSSILPPLSHKGKQKETEPLLRNVLRHNLQSGEDGSLGAAGLSPSRFQKKPKTPVSVLKEYNPYLPPDTDPAEWSGVVDLRDLSITTPGRRKDRSSRRMPATQGTDSDGDDDGDSFDGLPPGMSPPVMMSPARPPRSSVELGLVKTGQTPKGEVSARIKSDLLRDMHSNRETDSTMSTVPTPPSFSRYSRHGHDTTDSIVLESSLESMMRRVGLNVPSGLSSTPALRLRSKVSQQTSIAQMTSAAVPEDPLTPVHAEQLIDFDSDSDSLDEINNTAHPSAAFLMASAQRSNDSDDSFGSSNHSSDSLDDDGNLAPVHPFAQGMRGNVYDEDDSYDDDIYEGGPGEEETVFGVPPAQRLRAQAQAQALTQGGHLSGNLRMLGEDLLQDTIGVGAQMARSGRIEESPTPAGRV